MRDKNITSTHNRRWAWRTGAILMDLAVVSMVMHLFVAPPRLSDILMTAGMVFLFWSES